MSDEQELKRKRLRLLQLQEEEDAARLAPMQDSVPPGFQPGAVSAAVPAMGAYGTKGLERAFNIVPGAITAAPLSTLNKLKDLATGSNNTSLLKDFVDTITGNRIPVSKQLNKLGLPETVKFQRGEFGEYIPPDLQADVPMNKLLGGATDIAADIKGPQLVADVTNKILPEIKYFAGESHFRPSPTAKKIVGKEGMRDIIDESLKQKTIPWWGTVEDTGSNLEKLLNEKSGPALGKFREGTHVVSDPNAYYSKIQDSANTVSKLGESEDVRNSLLGTISDMKNKQGVVDYGPNLPMSFSDIAERTSVLGKKGKFNKLTEGEKALAFQKMFGESRNFEKSLLSPEELSQYEGLLGSYANQTDAALMAGRTSSLHGGGAIGRLADAGITVDALSAVPEGRFNKLFLIPARALTKGRFSGLTANAANALMSPAAQNIGRSLKIGSQITPSVWESLRLMNGENQ